jgi:hypothetical protein
MKQHISLNTPLFLLDFQAKKIHGVFKATGPAQLNIQPDAWKVTGQGRSFPAQIQVQRSARAFQTKPDGQRGGLCDAEVTRALLLTMGYYQQMKGSTNNGNAVGTGGGGGAATGKAASPKNATMPKMAPAERTREICKTIAAIVAKHNGRLSGSKLIVQLYQQLPWAKQAFGSLSKKQFVSKHGGDYGLRWIAPEGDPGGGDEVVLVNGGPHTHTSNSPQKSQHGNGQFSSSAHSKPHGLHREQ